MPSGVDLSLSLCSGSGGSSHERKERVERRTPSFRKQQNQRSLRSNGESEKSENQRSNGSAPEELLGCAHLHWGPPPSSLACGVCTACLQTV